MNLPAKTSFVHLPGWSDIIQPQLSVPCQRCSRIMCEGKDTAHGSSAGLPRED